jgi:hypothetical protein
VIEAGGASTVSESRSGQKGLNAIGWLYPLGNKRL